MSLDQDIELLRRVPLLADFTDEQLRLLAFGAEDREYPAGTILFEAGDRADSAFIVASGKVELRSADDTQLLATLSPGSLVGETALLTETIRATRAVTDQAAKLVRIRRSLFRRILREFPDIAARLHTKLAARLSKTIADINLVSDQLSTLDNDASDEN